MLRDDGRVVVLDFGIASSDETPVPLTLTGETVGTPGYMAPEVLRAGSGGVDRRADVWSLGVTLYECLTGSRPFAAATQDEEASRSLKATPLPLGPKAVTGINAKDLQVLLATALAKDPAHRYSSAAAFAGDLARLGDGEPLMARRPGPLQQLGRWARRRPALAAAVASIAVLAVVSIILFVRAERRLARFTRLADLETARDLLAARGDLLPPTSERVEQLESWLKQARMLLDREPMHRATFDRLPALERASWNFHDETGEAWIRAQLEDLLIELAVLRDFTEFIESRAELASSLERLATVDHAELWQAAATRVAADGRFENLALRPVQGMLPLGPDPKSGLEEFAHLATGAPAERDAESGQLRMLGATGVILILVPSGHTVVGASNPGEGLLNPDASCGPWDGPPQLVTLDPYFVSKFELTQGQWMFQRRDNPSYLTQVSRWIAGPSDLHPVEQFNVLTCREVLAEMGLGLPTEAQWEHAARAGSEQAWSFGDDSLQLGAHGNVADRTVLPYKVEVGWAIDERIMDGFVGHAPVGSFAPNRWGLHDVHGNVSEMTRSTFEDWREHPPKDGAGETDHKYELVVHRGAGYDSLVLFSRCSYRTGMPSSVAAASIGVRPILRYAP